MMCISLELDGYLSAKIDYELLHLFEASGRVKALSGKLREEKLFQVILNSTLAKDRVVILVDYLLCLLKFGRVRLYPVRI